MYLGARSNQTLHSLFVGSSSEAGLSFVCPGSQTFFDTIAILQYGLSICTDTNGRESCVWDFLAGHKMNGVPSQPAAVTSHERETMTKTHSSGGKTSQQSAQSVLLLLPRKKKKKTHTHTHTHTHTKSLPFQPPFIPAQESRCHSRSLPLSMPTHCWSMPFSRPRPRPIMHGNGGRGSYS